MDLLHKLLRMGVSYGDAITMPVRVVAKLMRSDLGRMRRVAAAAKRNKAMGVFDFGGMD